MGSSMSLAKVNNESFSANLYLDGLPVVLNQQRLQQTLRHKRITQGEKLDAEVGWPTRGHPPLSPWLTMRTILRCC